MKYTKGSKNKENKKTRETRKKTPIKTHPQQKTQSTSIKTKKSSITLLHINPLTFVPSRTETLSSIIDIALKV
jgi:hypothetical protein